MFKTIRSYYSAWRYKRAVRKAKKLAALFGMKYYVINLGGSLKVVPKQTVGAHKAQAVPQGGDRR